jgi:hypothetical protein
MNEKHDKEWKGKSKNPLGESLGIVSKMDTKDSEKKPEKKSDTNE